MPVSGNNVDDITFFVDFYVIINEDSVTYLNTELIDKV